MSITSTSLLFFRCILQILKEIKDFFKHATYSVVHNQTCTGQSIEILTIAEEKVYNLPAEWTGF